MTEFYPDYYKEFKCIADRCKHNCCIGWEIDIDYDTVKKYMSVEGDIGRKLRKSISFESTPHFILSEGERCPFLCENNLCELILTFGEDGICDICKQHPRFRNDLESRVELGLGLCCEEAARMIITKPECVSFIATSQVLPDEITHRRDRAISIMQNRNKTVRDRISEMLTLFNILDFKVNLAQWSDFLLKLERLDAGWTSMLMKLQKRADEGKIVAFEDYASLYETQYEQIVVYFLYRHLIKAENISDMAVRVAFAVLMYSIVYELGCVVFCEKGELSVEDLIEIARMLSSEIEYSEENTDAVIYRLYDDVIDMLF